MSNLSVCALRCLRAGYPYVLKFTVASTALSANFVLSEPFTVAIGPTVGLKVLTQPDHVWGGQAFTEQPIVALVVSVGVCAEQQVALHDTVCVLTTVQDAGGNINEVDQYSLITVSLAQNPTGGEILPENIRVQMPGTATLQHNSVYVTISGFDFFQSNLLDHGDYVEFGEVNNVSVTRALAELRD